MTGASVAPGWEQSLGWMLAGWLGEPEHQPTDAGQGESGQSCDGPIIIEDHGRNLPSIAWASESRLPPVATQITRLAAVVDALMVGTITPARIAPTPRLFSAVASNWTRAL